MIIHLLSEVLLYLNSLQATVEVMDCTHTCILSIMLLMIWYAFLREIFLSTNSYLMEHFGLILFYLFFAQKMFLGKVSAENPKFPCFCYGHSTGGAIVLKVKPDEINCSHLRDTCPSIWLWYINPVYLQGFLRAKQQAVLDPKVRQRISGIVLTSPAVGVQPSHPIFAVSSRSLDFDQVKQ